MTTTTIKLVYVWRKLSTITQLFLWPFPCQSNISIYSTGILYYVKIHIISVGYCKKDVTPLLTQWSYIFLALTHWYQPFPHGQHYICNKADEYDGCWCLSSLYCMLLAAMIILYYPKWLRSFSPINHWNKSVLNCSRWVHRSLPKVFDLPSNVKKVFIEGFEKGIFAEKSMIDNPVNVDN